MSRTTFYCTLPASKFQIALQLLRELVFCPVISAKRWEQERTVILNEYREGLDSPGRVLYQLIFNRLFGGSRLAHMPIGTPKSLESITAQDIRWLYKHQYNLRNIRLIVTGGLPKNCAELVQATFAGIKVPPGDKDKQPHEVPHIPPQTIALSDPQFRQPWIKVIRLLPQVPLRDKSIIDLARVMIHEGFSSPLYRTLRDDRQLYYSAQLMADNFVPGTSIVEFTCRTSPQRLIAVQCRFWGTVASALADKKHFALARERILSGVECYSPAPVGRIMDIADGVEHDDWIEKHSLRPARHVTGGFFFFQTMNRSFKKSSISKNRIACNSVRYLYSQDLLKRSQRPQAKTATAVRVDQKNLCENHSLLSVCSRHAFTEKARPVAAIIYGANKTKSNHKKFNFIKSLTFIVQKVLVPGLCVTLPSPKSKKETSHKAAKDNQFRR